ncbi:U3 snoRNP protein [Coemansia sp. S146]|nr:U3 snoRNP protein [Coemansia sp. S146]
MMHIAMPTAKRDLDEPDEHGSYFAETVSKWNELNCTEDYTEFLHRVRAYYQSLAQVLNHKGDIVCILEDYLSLDHELALEPMLELVTTLARDLQDEVLPYYERLVRKIMPLIKSNTPEIVEAASNALAYLFKYLSKSLVDDLRPTFSLISPLLGVERQQSGVRRFAAESLSFLIQKLRGDALQKFVEHVIHALVECPTDQLAGFRDGIALLFFECMRSVKSQLHSRASGMLAALLRELYKEELSGMRLESNDVYVLVAEVLKLCLHQADREASEQLWSVLFDQFDAQARAISKAEAVRIQPFTALQGLLAMSTIVRKGASVGDYKPLFQRCRELASQPKLEGFAMECPSLARLDRVLDTDLAQLPSSGGTNLSASMQYLVIAAAAQGSERIDYNNVYKQLLKMLADTGARAAETNSQPLVLTFLAYVKYDLGWTTSLFRLKDDEAQDLEDSMAGFYSEQNCGLLTSRSRRTTDALSALDCVLAWREPNLVPYADNLRNLVDDKIFRDKLKTFNLAVDGESINSVYRDRLLPVAFRLLHGQMVAHNGKSSRKDGMKTWRIAIFHAMAGITPAELRSFVFIGLDSFDGILAAATPRDCLVDELLLLSAANAKSEMDVDSNSDSSVGLSLGAVDAMKCVSTKAQSSYYHLFLDMVRQLRFKATPVFHETLVIILSSIGCAQR